MENGPIFWTHFSWEAFATLVTGLAAVLAAYVVGRRQISIQRAQTSLQQVSIRTALFEKRYSVFQRARQFVRGAALIGGAPSPETESNFYEAIGESQFLFQRSTTDGLQEISDKWAEYGVLRAEMDHCYQTSGSYGIGNPERERQALMWFYDRLKTLPELFGELMLSDTESTRF